MQALRNWKDEGERLVFSFLSFQAEGIWRRKNKAVMDSIWEEKNIENMLRNRECCKIGRSGGQKSTERF